MESESHVRARAAHGLGRLTLDRPRAINALSLDMIRSLQASLDAWQHASDVDIVLLDGAGERGLCAGGDVRGLHGEIAAGRGEQAATFFREEYHLNARIASYPKPVVAVADGITMGGGIGLAGHAAVRVVTERSRLAMPETRIGLTPDVGGSWLLARAPGRIGEYLALTGATMDAADALYAGFADHLVPSDRLDALRDALETRADPASPTELVLLFDETAETSGLERARAWIDEAFSADTVPEIVERLRALRQAQGPDGRAQGPDGQAQGPDPAATAATLEELSPTSLAVTLKAVRRARALPDLRAALEQEYRLVMWFALTQPDLLEGIRAQLVDKDRSPRWQPATIGEVGADTVAEAFAFTPPTPLWS